MIDDDFDPFAKLMELELNAESQAYAIESLNRRITQQDSILRAQRNHNQYIAKVIEQLNYVILTLDQEIRELKDEKAAGRPIR